jgi:integrase
LDWENIHLVGSQRFIEVAARKAKTRQRRIVSISDNLAAWLMPLAQVTGPVVLSAYRERHQRLQVLAKLTPWPRNVLRHSFGSYHLAFHKNEAPYGGRDGQLSGGDLPALSSTRDTRGSG